MAVALKRAYEKAAISDGTRVLVDRLWPRGVSKEAAALDFWLKELAPSNELRIWFHQRPRQWLRFRERYIRELYSEQALQALEHLHKLAHDRKKLTLVFSARDVEHNNAVVLKELLEGMRKPPSNLGREAVKAMPARKRMRRR